MGTSSAEVLVTLDRSKPRALRIQIEDELRAAIRAGRLGPGAAVPSTRALAGDLGVTRGVVVEAYDQLIAEGYLRAQPGGRTVVDAGGATRGAPAVVAAAAGPAVAVDFRPGLPDLSLFPRAAWGRATRSALASMPDADLGYGDPQGLPALRAALAEHLGRVRGVCADPEQVVVCDSFGHGFGLLARALGGTTTFAVEDPGYDGPREILDALGVPWVAVPVDGEGLSVDALRRSPVRAVVVTPAHQSPTGVVLGADRRRRLVEWAAAVDGVVVEDDYDAEYRYDRRPVGALQGVDPERVVYCGTLSKSLAPGLRLGWLVLPRRLVEPVVATRRVGSGTGSSITQATFAAFLESGDLDRHLRRARRVYRHRRDALVDALARHLPQLEPTGIAAGLNVLVRLPAGADETAMAAAALDAGVRVYPLSNGYRASRRSHPEPAWVLGYGTVTPDQAERGVRLLAERLEWS